MARNDLLRLLDSDIERAYQLCLALLRDEDRAMAATLSAVSSFGAQVTEEKKRLQRLAAKLLPQGVSRSDIRLNYLFIFQKLLYLKTKKAEERLENKVRPREFPPDVLLLRYLKYLATVAMEGPLEATVAYCRVLHDYTRSVAASVHDLLTQEVAAANREGDISRRKTDYDEYLRSRFSQLREGPREQGNVMRFAQAEKTEELIDYALSCLDLLKPWDMSCAIPEGANGGSVERLSYRGSDPTVLAAVEEQRVNTLMDYDCFTRLIRLIRIDSPLAHIQIPKFFVNDSTTPADPLDPKNLPGLQPTRLRSIKNKLADQATRRESIMPRRLKLIVDEDTQAAVTWDPARERTRRVPLNRDAKLIEVYEEERVEDIILASKLLRRPPPSSRFVMSSSVKWEQGQKISFRVSYVPGTGDAPVPSEVTIRYKETNWARALALLLRRVGSDATLGPARSALGLSSFLNEFARPLNVLMQFAVAVFCVLLLAVISVYLKGPFLPSEVVQIHPTPSPLPSPSPAFSPTTSPSSTPASSPSPLPSATAQPTKEAPGASGPGGEEIARSAPPRDITTPRIDITKPGSGKPSGEEPGGSRSGGAVTTPKTIPLPEVRTVFVRAQEDRLSQQIAAAIQKRLRDLGIRTDVDENQADAALTISAEAPGRFSFVMVSGREEIWGPITLNVSDRSAAAADDAAASVVGAIEKARRR